MKTIKKIAIVGITCSAIVSVCAICQHFNIMPAYWVIAPVLAIAGTVAAGKED